MQNTEKKKKQKRSNTHVKRVKKRILCSCKITKNFRYRSDRVCSYCLICRPFIRGNNLQIFQLSSVNYVPSLIYRQNGKFGFHNNWRKAFFGNKIQYYLRCVIKAGKLSQIIIRELNLFFLPSWKNLTKLSTEFGFMRNCFLCTIHIS